MKIIHPYLAPLLNGFIILLALWLTGLVLFAQDVAATPTGALPPGTPKAEGIVVLTGGSERLPAGLDLLMKEAAPKLLISGVDPRVAPEKIIPDNHPARVKKTCCITFGTMAEDTYGNALEAAAWAKENGMLRVIIVTAHYHMRRSLLEFHTAMPGVVLVPFAVEPDHVKVDAWWDYPGTASLLISEYNKLLAAYVKAALQRAFREPV